MNAVIRECGLSAGAVYLYFRSKQEIIHALAAMAISGVTETIEGLAAAEETLSPEEALAAVATRVLTLGEELEVDLPRVALQAWAEAARDPEVRALLAEEAQRIRAAWVRYATRAVAAGHLAADADPERAAESLMTMLPGFMVTRTVIGGVTPEQYAAGLAELRRHSPREG
jgi:AcrR family transcriptional regulator